MPRHAAGMHDPESRFHSSTAAIALGIISGPTFTARRQAIRSTWLPRIDSSMACVFVVRCGCMSTPERLIADWYESDLLRVQSVCLNETRVRAPILLLHAWFHHALRNFKAAQWIGKIDDDVWLHPKALVMQLTTVTRLRKEVFAYFGAFQFGSWKNDSIVGFGYRHFQARRIEGAVGPFAFTTGFCTILSYGLAALLMRSTVSTDEVQRVRSLTLPATRHQVVYEDVWLGALIHMHARQLPRLLLVDLIRSGAVTDE